MSKHNFFVFEYIALWANFGENHEIWSLNSKPTAQECEGCFFTSCRFSCTSSVICGIAMNPLSPRGRLPANV